MLKLRIKPEGKLFVNGNGWIKNVGNRPMDVVVSEDLKCERPKHAVKLLKEKMEDRTVYDGLEVRSK